MNGRRWATARTAWRTVHLALALIAGLWFAMLGVTGSLLVFHKEIDALLNPELLVRQSGDGDVPIAAAIATVGGSVGPVLRIDAPADNRGVYRLQARSRSAPAELVEVFVDPGSGEILGTRAWRSNVVAVLYDLHYTLLAGRSGRDFLGFVGLALLASVASGLYLWWPRGRSLRQALRIKARAPAVRRLYDLHKSVGLPAAMLLAVSALSGATMQFPETTRTIVQALLPAASFETRAEAEARNIEHAILQARAIVPDGRVRRVLLPDGEAGAYRIYLRRPDEVLKSSGLNVVSIDRRSGTVASVRTTADFRGADWFVAWQFPLHNGEAFGLAGRIVIFFLGFAPLTLYVTGLMLWWSRRHARRARKRCRRNAREPRPTIRTSIVPDGRAELGADIDRRADGNGSSVPIAKFD